MRKEGEKMEYKYVKLDKDSTVTEWEEIPNRYFAFPKYFFRGYAGPRGCMWIIMYVYLCVGERERD